MNTLQLLAKAALKRKFGDMLPVLVFADCADECSLDTKQLREDVAKRIYYDGKLLYTWMYDVAINDNVEKLSRNPSEVC